MSGRMVFQAKRTFEPSGDLHSGVSVGKVGGQPTAAVGRVQRRGSQEASTG